jgi:hypothetical protein
METITVTPQVATGTLVRRAAASVERLPRISSVMPSSIAYASRDCTWSNTMIAAHATRMAPAFQANHKALKAFGSRRLGETST